MSWTKAKTFWPVFLVLLLADCGTKRIAVEQLSPHAPHEVFGGVLRFTLAYNPGAAFGLFAFGPGSQTALAILSIGALGVLAWLYRSTSPAQTAQLVALGLIAGGAVGNLIDRLRAGPGVIDFIDVGYGTLRWWTFNLADAGITTGAILLIWKFGRQEDARPESTDQSVLA